MTFTHNARVVLRRQPRVLRPKGAHDPPQAQVAAGRHEGRPNRQAAYLDHEAVLVPRIVPAENPAQIPQHLADEAENQRHVEGHAAPGDYQDERVGHQRRPEYAQERGIRREIDPVLVEAGHVIAQRALGIVPAEDLGVFEGAAAGHGAAFAQGA